MIVWEHGGPVELDAPGCCPECRHFRWAHDGVTCLQPGCPSRVSAPAPAPKQPEPKRKRGKYVPKENAALRKKRIEQEYLRTMGLKQTP